MTVSTETITVLADRVRTVLEAPHKSRGDEEWYEVGWWEMMELRDALLAFDIEAEATDVPIDTV